MSESLSGSRRLPFSSKLSFGIGQISEGVIGVVFNTFTLFFFNQIIGVSASLSGTALAIAMIFDAVSDPVAGSISDRLKSRLGRRLPLMAGSAIPLALCIIALFNPPTDMPQLFYFGWLVVFAVLARFFLTLYYVPYMALGADIAHDYTDRTRVFSYSQAFGTLGTALFTFLMYSFVFPTPQGGANGLLNATGYPHLALTVAGIVVATIFLCVWGTKKEVPHLPTWTPAHERFSWKRLWREVAQAMGSRSYRMLLIGMIVILLVLGIEGTFNIYIYVHFWELSTEQMRWLGPMTLVGLPFSVLMIPQLTKHFDKRRLLIALGAIVQVNMNILIILRLFTNILPANGNPMLFYLFLGSAFITGLMSPALLITFNSMFADVGDELEFRAGVRQEGIIYAARSFSAKTAGGLATILGGVALDFISFPRGAEVGQIAPDIIYRLGLIAAPPALLLGLSSLTFFLRYDLSRERMNEIRDALVVRRRDSVRDSASYESPLPMPQPTAD